jgi:hypothetical protein
VPFLLARGVNGGLTNESGTQKGGEERIHSLGLSAEWEDQWGRGNAIKKDQAKPPIKMVLPEIGGL